MDAARDDIGRRIVEAARLAVWLHLKAEQDAQPDESMVSEYRQHRQDACATVDGGRE